MRRGSHQNAAEPPVTRTAAAAAAVVVVTAHTAVEQYLAMVVTCPFQHSPVFQAARRNATTTLPAPETKELGTSHTRMTTYG